MEAIRITEVLDYFKEPWYLDWVLKVGKREANRIGKEAMKIGSRVDELIKTNTPTSKKDSVEVNNAMQAFDKWKAVYQPKSITPCTRLNATIEGIPVTGEPDIMVDGVVVDLKCASKISKKYWVQVNMYSYLSGLENKVGILRLDKVTGSFEYVVKDYDPSLVGVWCGMAKAYVYLKENKDGDEL